MLGLSFKKRVTYNKVRLALFVRSYAGYTIIQHIRTRYKINGKSETKELRSQYFSKKAIPEISRLSKALSFNYRYLWQSILLNKNQPLGKQISDKEGIKIYLSIESELVMLTEAKYNRSHFFDPDYESEFAVLSIAIERAVGNKLINIEDDSVFEHQQEILQKLYLRWYYKVAWKYKLPTTRIVPFVLRLINK